MELSWLESLIYGFLSGLAEFLPVSSEGHRALFLKMIGGEDHPVIRLAVHLGALAALLIFSTPMLSRIRRERRIQAIPPQRRKRPPDIKSLLDFRIWRTATVALVLLYFAYPVVSSLHQRLWLLAIFFGISGIILYIPQFTAGSNKDSQSLSSLDAVLIGLSGGFGCIPGISGIGTTISVGLMRGADRRYAFDMSLLLAIPMSVLLIMFDLWWLIAGAAGAVSAMMLFLSLMAAVCSFFGAYIAMFVMRFLSVKIGYSGFAYYCWGMALFTLILYLIIS